jgi:SAM-dependent methyltransferase
VTERLPSPALSRQLPGVVGRHLYNSTLNRVKWFVRRFGAGEVVLKPLRLLFAPVILPGLRPERFTFRGRAYGCFYARYNMTWVGERMVEIPIGQALLQSAAGGRILEVGNVLSHYFPAQHAIVDKFERGPGVLNLDILAYQPPERFDLIVSISTFEHIGFDDDTPSSSGEKILQAIAHCRRLLSPAGRLILTFPTGYNPELDDLLRTGQIGAQRLDCLLRVAPRKWEECDLATALAHPYRTRFPYGNALVVAEFNAPV